MDDVSRSMIIDQFANVTTVPEAIWGQKRALLMSTPVCQSGMGLQPDQPLVQPMQETSGLREQTLELQWA